jgi:DNA repair exonuclease SbcCD ATPase subunit
LRLAFDDQLKAIRKGALVRLSDGSLASRSLAQTSGGEWRRLSLALSLAFADFARVRLGVQCNVLVLDEVRAQPAPDSTALELT